MKNFTKLLIVILCFFHFDLIAQNLTNGEYFFNTDPGVGNGIALPSFTASDTINSNLTISTVGLSAGFHNLFIRYKDVNNNWGIYEGRSFYISPPNVAQPLAGNITNAEYFFNTDPGVGNGIALASFSPSDTIDSNLSISTTGLPVGLHNLFVRYQDADNKWGIYEGREFEVVNCTQPTADFTVNQNICFGDTINFINNSSNTTTNTTYEWDLFNDGVVDATFAGSVFIVNAAVGTYDLKLALDHLGCRDSIVKTYSVVAPYTINDTAFVCIGSNFTFADGSVQNNVTSNTSHINDLQSVFGCDSTVTTYLFIKPTYSSSENIAVCSGASYTFPDGSVTNNITSNMTYTSNLTTSQFCDSIIITNVSINPSYNATVNIGVCAGASYTFPDGITHSNITANGSYTSNFQTVNFCDSLIVTNISVTANYQFSETVSVCSGESFTFPDGTSQSNITSPVVYTSTLTGIGSCDTLMETTVTVNPVYNMTDSINICSGTDYIFPDGTLQTNINTAVSHVSNLQSMNACDSIVTTHLSVTQTPIAAFTPEDSLACANDSLFLFDNSSNLSASTTYFWDFNDGQVTASTIGDEFILYFVGVVEVELTVNTNGCKDSTTHTLYSNPAWQTSFNKTICSGESYTFPDGSVINNAQSDTVHASALSTITGCDSTVITNLTVTQIPNADFTVNYNEICEGDTAYLNLVNAPPTNTTYAWDLNNDGSIESTFAGNISISNLNYDFDVSLILDNQGCLDTSVLFVDYITSFEATVLDTVCEGTNYTFPDGSTSIISSALTQVSTLANSFSCDSVITTVVYMNPSYNFTENINLCSGSNYTFPDGTVHSNITSNESYTSSFQTVSSCDSIIVTNIIISANYQLAESFTVCSGESHTFPDGTIQNNMMVNLSYTSMLQTINGCDSTIVTSILVNASYEETEMVNLCMGADYVFPDGTELTNLSSNVSHVNSFTTIAGCDSIIYTEIEIEDFAVSISESNNVLSTTINNVSYQWINCKTGEAIAGETNSSFSPQENGDYGLQITSASGCVSESDCISFVKVGIEEEITNTYVKVYPNPFLDNLLIEIGTKNAQIEIVNITGKLIYTTNQKDRITQVNLQSLSSGVYFVNIIKDNRFQTFKVIKK